MPPLGLASISFYRSVLVDLILPLHSTLLHLVWPLGLVIFHFAAESHIAILYVTLPLHFT